MLSLAFSGRVFQILVILLRYNLWKVKAFNFTARIKRVLGLLADHVEREGASGLERMSGPNSTSPFKASKKKKVQLLFHNCHFTKKGQEKAQNTRP